MEKERSYTKYNAEEKILFGKTKGLKLNIIREEIKKQMWFVLIRHYNDPTFTLRHNARILHKET